MTQKISAFLDVSYGWNKGEDNWNVGMDQNLLKFSALLDKSINGIVSALPAMDNGDMYFNTTDNRLYYNVDSIINSVALPIGFLLTLRSNGNQYVFNGTSLVPAFDQVIGDGRYVPLSSTGAFGMTLLGTTTATAARSSLGLGTASLSSADSFEPTIATSPLGGAVYWNGNKAWVSFDAKVLLTPLQGFSTSVSSAVVATDSVLAAFGKLQAQVSLRATSNSAALTGTPSAPTAPAGTSNVQIANTLFVQNAVSSRAPIDSPAFSGTPTANTAAPGTNTTQLATTAFVASAPFLHTTGGTLTGSLSGTQAHMGAFIDKHQNSFASETFQLFCADISVFSLTLSGATTLVVGSMPTFTANGEIFTVVIRIIQPATAQTLNWFRGITWLTSGGIAPTTPTANKTVEYVFTNMDGTGAAWVGRVGASN